ncbi:MAG TPA: hypothetical protein VNL14_15695 [Candidatus Acidoferrales bacterium]|nr:hypothetical protein [Candidatus Acidoferrales bacterium]
MIATRRGAEAADEIQRWAQKIARASADGVEARVYHDADSNTYVVRLAKRNRVLLFRFSEAQVFSAEREAECEKILRTKIKDLETRR